MAEQISGSPKDGEKQHSASPTKSANWLLRRWPDVLIVVLIAILYFIVKVDGVTAGFIGGLYGLVRGGVWAFRYLEGNGIPVRELAQFALAYNPLGDSLRILDFADIERLVSRQFQKAIAEEYLAGVAKKGASPWAKRRPSVSHKSFRKTNRRSVNHSAAEPALIFRQLARACRDRLGNEIQVSARRCTLNLVLGMFLAVLGLLLLLFFFWESKSANTFWEQALALFSSSEAADTVWTQSTISRIAVVIFTETLSLFFLRLYRSGLAEIRYSQNELTNIELKVLGLEVALSSGDAKNVETAVVTLMGTERNPLFGAGQTTARIELERVPRDAQLVEQLSELIKNLKKS